MLCCGLSITHFSFSLLSFIFIPFFHFILSHLIFFSHLTRCSIWVQHPHIILDLPIDIWCLFIYHHYSCGNPRSMTHEVFYALCLTHEGYGDCFIRVIKHVMARGLTHVVCPTLLIKRHANRPISMFCLGNMPEGSLMSWVGRDRDKCIRKALIAWKPNVTH